MVQVTHTSPASQEVHSAVHVTHTSPASQEVYSAVHVTHVIPASDDEPWSTVSTHMLTSQISSQMTSQISSQMTSQIFNYMTSQTSWHHLEGVNVNVWKSRLKDNDDTALSNRLRHCGRNSRSMFILMWCVAASLTMQSNCNSTCCNPEITICHSLRCQFEYTSTECPGNQGKVLYIHCAMNARSFGTILCLYSDKLYPGF